MIKQYSIYLFLAAGLFAAGYAFKSSQEPAKVTEKTDLTQTSVVNSDQAKASSESAEASSTTTRKLTTKPDGSSVLTEKIESASKMQKETLEALRVSEEVVLKLRQEIIEKNKQARVNGLLMYDSERMGIEAEANVSYDIYSAAAGKALVGPAWRAGIGLGFTF